MVAGADPQKFAQAVDAHIGELKERKKERLLLLSDKQVKDITEPFDNIIRATTQSSTQPSTQPATPAPPQPKP